MIVLFKKCCLQQCSRYFLGLHHIQRVMTKLKRGVSTLVFLSTMHLHNNVVSYFWPIKYVNDVVHSMRQAVIHFPHNSFRSCSSCDSKWKIWCIIGCENTSFFCLVYVHFKGHCIQIAIMAKGAICIETFIYINETF